jgi:hypothetical protein
VNNFPIRDFFKREVVKADDGKLLLRGAGVADRQLKDAYWEECKLAWYLAEVPAPFLAASTTGPPSVLGGGYGCCLH